MPVACRAEHVGWLGTAACGGGGVCKTENRVKPQECKTLGACKITHCKHTPQSLRDSSPNLGEQLEVA